MDTGHTVFSFNYHMGLGPSSWTAFPILSRWGWDRKRGRGDHELLLSVDPPGVSRGKVFGDFVSCWAGGVLFRRHDYLSRFGSEE